MARDPMIVRRANLGCGGQIGEGWVNIDRGDAGQEHVLDMRDGLPFDDGELDYAVAHHVLDLFAPEDLAAFLDECYRVLRVGGLLRISNADLLGAFAAADRRSLEWFRMVTVGTTVSEKLAWYVTCGGARQTLLTRKTIEHALIDAGFWIAVYDGKTAWADDSICELDSRHNESVYVEAVR